MKKISIALLAIALVVISCKKKEPTPSPVQDTGNNNNNTNTTQPPNKSFCAGSTDSICTLPYNIMPTFVPSGYYEYAETTVGFALDKAETPAYESQNIRIKYAWNDGYWGASFLNNNSWSSQFKIKPGVTKMSLYARINYTANVTFNPFGTDDHGKRELYRRATAVANPIWEYIEIPLTNPPTSFNTPLGIVIDGYEGTLGDTIVVDIKDIWLQ